MPNMRTIPIGPWPKGIHNSARDYVLPQGGLLDALNVDITDEGHCRTRRGYRETVAIDNGHSLSNQGDKVLIGIGATLGVITARRPLEITTVRTGLSVLPISYAELAGEVWWSNGEDSGRIGTDNSDHPWAVEPPASPLSISAGAGSLFPGTYGVVLTHSMADGEESGASPVSLFDMASTGAMVITLPAPAGDATHFNVYCTGADGSTFQLAETVPVATASVTITEPATGRQIGRRYFLEPLPPGDCLAIFNGRMISAKGPWLFYSEPYDFGVYDPVQNYIRFAGDISIVAPCENGVFVVADQTYWLAGADIDKQEMFVRLPSGAVKGTSFRHPLTNAVGWFGADGFVIGTPDGAVHARQRDNGFSSPSALTGATLIRQENGMIHAVCSMDGTSAYGRDVSDDFMVAMDTYHDDATTVCYNLTGGGTSRYSGWHFNSFATIGGDYYGIDSAGLRLLQGDDDQGEEILSVIHLGRVGFGTSRMKSLPAIYVTGKGENGMLASISDSFGNGPYDYPSRSHRQGAYVQRITPGRGLRDAFFPIAIMNVDGGFIEVSAVEVMVSESSRRI